MRSGLAGAEGSGRGMQEQGRAGRGHWAPASLGGSSSQHRPAPSGAPAHLGLPEFQLRLRLLLQAKEPLWLAGWRAGSLLHSTHTSIQPPPCPGARGPWRLSPPQWGPPGRKAGRAAGLIRRGPAGPTTVPDAVPAAAAMRATSGTSLVLCGLLLLLRPPQGLGLTPPSRGEGPCRWGTRGQAPWGAARGWLARWPRLVGSRMGRGQRARSGRQKGTPGGDVDGQGRPAVGTRFRDLGFQSPLTSGAAPGPGLGSGSLRNTDLGTESPSPLPALPDGLPEDLAPRASAQAPSPGLRASP